MERPNDISRFIPQPEQAALVLIDFQERLIAAMPAEVQQSVLRNAGILIKACLDMGCPIILLEQYPQGLRRTVPEIRSLIPDIETIEKVAFNCCEVPAFMRTLQSLDRRDLILCGMESHICILQTSFGLLERDYRPFIPADAVCSRSKHNWRFSLDLMRQAGAVIGTTETLLFLMNNTAGSERFVRLSRLVR